MDRIADRSNVVDACVQEGNTWPSRGEEDDPIFHEEDPDDPEEEIFARRPMFYPAADVHLHRVRDNTRTSRRLRGATSVDASEYFDTPHPIQTYNCSESSSIQSEFSEGDL